MSRGIVYEYEDGGRYCGEWEEGKAHGHGVCSGPEGAGLFEGRWEAGNQVSGVYTWPSNQRYTGRWEDGLREGGGQETKPDQTEYTGEFTKDSRGPFGVLKLPNSAVYRGSWNDGVQDGEGVETYVDGGVYCGQYKNGLRHGYGKRSSASFERSCRNHSNSKQQNSTSSLALASGSSANLSTSESSPNLVGAGASSSSPSLLQKHSASLTSDPTAQMYSGEWREDRRHGHGVLDVRGHYKFYGQWDNNARTGYGVAVYSDRRKEEGLWQNGKLINVLKHKKLAVLKGHQMEGKVKQAHTLALQAAEEARNKSMLAEARAAHSEAKARSAMRVVMQAVQDMQHARDKAELHKNSPRVAETVKSPLGDAHMEFPPLDTATSSRPRCHAPSDSLDLLRVNCDISTSASFENVAMAASDSANAGEFYSAHSSGSSSSVESMSPDHGTSHDSLDRGDMKGSFEESDSIASGRSNGRRKKLYSKSESIGSSRSSFEGESEVDTARKRNSLTSGRDRAIPLSTADALRQRRQDLVKMNVISESDTSLGGNGFKGRHRRDVARSGRMSDAGSLSKHSSHRHSPAAREHGSRRVDNSTGELGHSDSTDDESFEDPIKRELPRPTSLPPPPRPLTKKPSFTMEMLQHMANWNRMVAYLNVALLIFLVLLIVVVVITLNYLCITQQAAGPGGLPQHNPTGFMTPMA